MKIWTGFFSSPLIAILGVYTFSGCGGDGGPTGSEAPPAVQQISPAAKSAADSKQGGQITTPARSIDTKQLTDVVKEEVKGGESSEGPSPFDYLWEPSKGDVDQRRADDRIGSRRIAAAHSQDLRPSF